MDDINQNISVNEKLRGFTDIALKEAYRRKEHIIDTAEKENSEAKKKKELEFLEEAYYAIQNGTRKLRKELNESVSKALVDGKKKMFEKRREIIDDIFSKVANKLREFTKTDDYKRYIIDNINESIKAIGKDQYELYVNKDETELYRDILDKEEIDLSIKESSKDIMGGFIIFGLRKRLMADCSFKIKMQKAREDFLEYCNLPIKDGDLN